MRSLALTLDEQRACVRGECNGTLVDASSVRLIGGADARAGLVVARVTRIAVRLTAWWAEIMESALEVPEKYPASSLALRLVIPCLPLIAKDFDAHQGRLMKLAGSLDAVTVERLAREVKAVTGTTTTAFKKAVEEAESPVREGRYVPTEEDLIVPPEVFPVPAGEQAPVVVMVSAHHRELVRVRGNLAGCDAYLAKPLRREELYELMRRYGVEPVQPAPGA
jgi:CheY-like chemotaxis protein